MWIIRISAVALAIALTACSSILDREQAAIDASPNEASAMQRTPESMPEPIASNDVEPPVDVVQAKQAPVTSRPVVNVEPRPKPKPVVRSQPEPKPKSESKPEPIVETRPEPVAQVQPKPKPKPEPEPIVETKSEPVAQAQPKPKPKPKAEPESILETKPEPVAQAKPEPKTVAVNSISGRIELDAGAGQRVAPGEVAQAVVYFLPRSGGAKPKPGRFNVDTHSKGFNPVLSVVPVGSTVSFTNKDEILHNVFSATPGSAFDLGTYGPGETRSTQFSKAGLVIVNCNVHNSMRANVLVLSTPYYTRPRADGRFVLEDLPPGPGTLVFWHPRARAQSQAINGPVKEPVMRRLVASRPPLDSHAH